jgi:gamma-glutamylcyclotransferase (GGCT)/AIG2-like uncharacterized protein YtfP
MSQSDPSRNAPPALAAFAYGTLKRGYWNHAAHCRGFASVREARVRGELFEFANGIPLLRVPAEGVLAEGTADPLADAALQARLAREAARDGREPPGGFEGPLVLGELLTFDDPAERLPPLDALEDFVPGGPSRYRRVLLPILLGDGAAAGSEWLPAWAYIGERFEGLRAIGSEWPPKRRKDEG